MVKNCERTYLIQNVGVFLIVIGYFDVVSNAFAVGTVLGLSALAYRHFRYGSPIFELGRENIPWQAIFVMLFFCILILIAAFFTVNSEVSIDSAVHRFNYMRPFFLLLLLANFRTGFFQAIWFGIVVGGIALCFAGENALKQFFILNIPRPSGSHSHPNVLAAHLVIIIPAIVAGICDKRFYKGLKIIAIICLLLVVFTMLLTGSRGAFLALLFASVWASLYYAHNRKKTVIAILVVATIVLAVTSIFSHRTIAGLGTIVEYQNTATFSERGRIYLWQGTWEMVKDYPVFGVGRDNFNKVYNEKYIPAEATEFHLPHAHNIILAGLSETGIVGLFGLLLLLSFQIRFVYKQRFKLTSNIYPDMMFFTIIIMLVHGMVDTFQGGSYARYYWIVWGTTCLSVIYHNNSSTKSSSKISSL